jgi:hypothetical protein
MKIKLGIFAGGFKPFTSGHFSKLALASRENDRVVLLYGISSRMKGSNFLYSKEMAEQIYVIVANALEREIPNLNVVKAIPSPIACSFDILGQVANNKSPFCFSLNEKGISPSNVSQITIYSDPTDIQVYKKHINTPKEEQYFGNLIKTNRLIFDTGLDAKGDDKKIIDALTNFYPEDLANQEGWIKSRARVRGSEFRSLISQSDIEQLKSYLPPVLNTNEKLEIIKILKSGLSVNESKNYFQNLLIESSPESHILNFYEDLSMSIKELKEAIRALLEGDVEEVQEKIDGQNLTFTVRNNQIETFSKGLNWNRLQKGGKKFEDYDQIYSSLPTVRDAFKLSHQSLQSVVNKNLELTNELFQNGKVAIEGAMLIPSNPNTIIYEKPHIVFIEAFALAPELEGQYNEAAYQKWINLAKKEKKSDLAFTEVPVLKLKQVLNSDTVAAELETELNTIIKNAGLSPTDDITIGDLLIGLARKKLQNFDINEVDRNKIAIRIVTGNKKDYPLKNFDNETKILIKKLESSPFLDEIRIPIEKIIQKLAVTVFRNLDFALASNETKSGQELRNFVIKVKQSFKEGNILADPVKLNAIRVALNRIENEKDFEKAVEGIVFKWKGNTRKLTGLFTPINKLRGFFEYGSTPAKFNEHKLPKYSLRHIWAV